MSLRDCERYRAKLLRRISATATRQDLMYGNEEFLEREIRRYLSNANVQRAALAQMWRRDMGVEAFNSDRAPRLEQHFVPYRLGRCNLAQIRWRKVPKSTGGFRKVCDFPSGLKVHHLLAKDILHAVCRPRLHIGDWAGRGRDLQVSQIKAAIQSPEQYVVYADVVSCFATTSFEHVYDLRILPEQFVRRALDYRQLRFRQIDEGSFRAAVDHWGPIEGQDANEASPRNLLEGSPVSNALWAMMIDDLPDHLPDSIRLFVYCDNIVVIAPSHAVAQQSQAALVDYFCDHCAGPFELRHEVHAVTEQFSHLGYDIHLSRSAGLWVGPSNKNIGKLIWRTRGAEYKDADNIRWLLSSFSEMTDNAKSVFLDPLSW